MWQVREIVRETVEEVVNDRIDTLESKLENILRSLDPTDGEGAAPRFRPSQAGAPEVASPKNPKQRGESKVGFKAAGARARLGPSPHHF